MNSQELRVLHVNATLSEGGAAGVARTLYDELQKHGVASAFAYGYGPRASNSPLANKYAASRLAPKSLVALNRASHAMTGRDRSIRASNAWRGLREEVNSADLVHLHVIHSYYLGTSSLVELLTELGKPVTWTLHDQWIMTGRCAQPGACTRWQTGCHPCPDLRAYPPAWVDRTETIFPERRNLIEELRRAVPTAIVSCADWLRDEAVLAGLGPVDVVKNSVDAEFWEALAPRKSRSESRLRLVFICRELGDARKVDWDMLAAVARMPFVELTIVGDHAPGKIEEARRLPTIQSRVELARLLGAMDALIFTSTVDYFPLTIAEALAAGLRVLAAESAASREFKVFGGVTLFRDRAEAESALASMHGAQGRREETTAQFFAPARMAGEYRAIYDRLMGGVL